MAKITIDKDPRYEWNILPESYSKFPHYLTLDLPHATVEWIKKVEQDWGTVQQILDDAAERHYAQREAERQARTV